MATNVSPSAPPQSLPETPDFINALAEIRNLSTALSTALSAFYRRYDELQNHLSYVKTAIDSKLPDQLDQLALIPLPETSPKPSLPEPVDLETEPDRSANSELKPDSQKQNLKLKPDTQKSNLKSKPDSQKSNLKSKPDSQNQKPILKPKPESTIDSVTEAKCQKPVRSGRPELENLCDSMCGRYLRRYISARLSDITTLLEEVPKALKLARNPPKLVLECMGGFYLQGSKAYTKGTHMIEIRRACVLALECFLLMEFEGLEIENAVEREAAEAAVAWRKRIMSEGGFDNAIEIDARGLLMLISGFGIPKVFTNVDIRDLVMAGRVRTISSALRRSSYLVPRIPSIIDSMVRNNMEVKAADIAYTFGLEDKCSPQKILTTFLSHRTNSKIQGSSEEVKTAKKKQLADLKSVIRCLEVHKIDPSNLLPESKINEKITSLEKEITELDKKAKEKDKEKAAVKRKARESDSLKNLKNEDVKRSRLTGHGDGRSSYSGLGKTNSSLLDERFPGSDINNYSASPSAPTRFRRPEDITGSIVNSSPYGRVYRQSPVGQMASRVDGQLYEWPALNERMISQTYAGQSQSYAAAPSRGDTALSERLLTQGYAGQSYGTEPSSSGLSASLYRPSQSQSSLEGFAGLPTSSAGVWNRGSGSGTDVYQFAHSVRGSGSDLYQFADSVVETESYNTSSSDRAGGGNLHRSSYLY